MYNNSGEAIPKVTQNIKRMTSLTCKKQRELLEGKLGGRRE